LGDVVPSGVTVTNRLSANDAEANRGVSKQARMVFMAASSLLMAAPTL
jgi:hypothetical protein